MKKIFKLTLLAAALMVVQSACDEGFDELNTSKTGAIAIDPLFQLNNAIISSSFPGATVIYDVGIVQQIISPNSGVLTGANYNQDNRDATEDVWQGYYRNVVRNTRDVIARTAEVPERANLMHMARIIQAHAFMVLTDEYGDIPYDEGGNGYLDQVFFPVYESQQAIYPKIIQELREASAALDVSGKIETGDILYGGDVTKWKLFANSLLLRAGMRLSKVDATQAAQVANEAVSAGVITSNSDNAVRRHDNNYLNPVGNMLNSTEAANFYMTEPFVNYLKSTNDPRLSAIAVRYVGATSGPEQTADRESYDAADQIGMPMGHDNGSIIAVAADLGLASFYDFTQVDRYRVAGRDAPQYFVTASQTLLLMAEAAHRGWLSTSTTAGEYYNDGVRAHMEQMADYGDASAIDPQAVDDYLAANPFDPGTALQQINTQYWISSLMNGPETFANFRRSGYPVLTPNPFPGQDITSEDFIRRLTYPNSEISVNTDNVNAAIARQGADKLDTRVWWDVP